MFLVQTMVKTAVKSQKSPILLQINKPSSKRFKSRESQIRLKTSASPHMPRTEKPARGAKKKALNKLATLKTAVAPKKPATKKQLAAIKKATAINKQKAEELKIRREHEQEKRDYKSKRRQMDKEFSMIMEELAYDDSKYDRFKVQTEVLEATGEYFETYHPFLSPFTNEGRDVIQRKRCELAHAKMQKFRTEKARLKRKRREGISFR